MQLLAGRTAVITGAAQGLGHSIAVAFAEQGAKVVLDDISAEHVAATATSLNIGERAIGIRCDVTDADDMSALLDTAIERYGSLDVLVNNAGFTRDATMRKMSEQDFDSVIAVHLKGTWLGVRAASALMRERGIRGSIVNVSSISGKVGNAGQTNYSAAKAGIVVGGTFPGQ